jgi:hypothetical protein
LVLGGVVIQVRKEVAVAILYLVLPLLLAVAAVVTVEPGKVVIVAALVAVGVAVRVLRERGVREALALLVRATQGGLLQITIATI